MKLECLRRILSEELSVQEINSFANPKSISEQTAEKGQTVITGISFDSRTVEKGHIFVAVTGVVANGHEYIPSAVEKGAAAVICEELEAFTKYTKLYPDIDFYLVKSARRALAIASAEFYDHACDSLHIIGITGTKGKTSTSFMIQRILKESGLRCGIIGTNGAYFEDFYEEMEHSTPESRDLHRLFSEMKKRGATHVVMEVSSQALMMFRVFGITYDTAIFTNITPDHIGTGEHKDFEEYLFYKGKLFSMCKNAVINLDSDKSEYILDICRENNVGVTTFACGNENADYKAKDEKFFIDKGMKTKYTITGKDDLCDEIEVSVPGSFSVFNSLCAASTALSMGISIDCIKNALLDVKVVGRIEPVHDPRLKVPVIIDYAHNAVSLESLFTAVKAYSPKRMICVFGCGGNRSKLRRYEMGEISGKYADISIITTDNSRFEELDDIISDILIGMKKTDGKYEIVKDRHEAIFRAIDIALPGDIVLLAGKGQETYLDIKGVKTHFDERDAVKEYCELADKRKQ